MKPAPTAAEAASLVAILATVGITFVGCTTALLGCILAQIFLPAQARDWRRAVWVILGSVIFGSLFSPLLLDLVNSVHALDSQEKIDSWRIYAGAVLGFFAQPLILWCYSMLPAVLGWATSRIPKGQP